MEIPLDFNPSIKLAQQIADCVLQSHVSELDTIIRALRFADEILGEHYVKKLRIPVLSQVSAQSAEANPTAV